MDPLDEVLTLQFHVAWAGETPADGPRLQWWRTDLIDPDSGGDFMRRLAPRTHRWAALEAAREAARLADQKARHRLADPDSARTLFFWGFEFDELLADRLRERKTAQDEPPTPGELNEADFKALSPDTRYTVLGSGRELWGIMPTDPALAARMLVSARRPSPPNIRPRSSASNERSHRVPYAPPPHRPGRRRKPRVLAPPGERRGESLRRALVRQLRAMLGSYAHEPRDEDDYPDRDPGKLQL